MSGQSEGPKQDPGDVSSADFSQKSLWRRLNDFLFGYDYFISYAWADGRSYAVRLAEKLEEHRLECFLDSEAYAKGDDWKLVGRRALKKTSRLILVGSPMALESQPVLREVEIFTSGSRHLIPISFAGSLDKEQTSAEVLKRIPADILRIEEPSERLASGPSAEVIDELTTTFQLLTQEQKRTRVFAAAAFVFATVAVLAVLFWRSSEVNRRAAERRLVAAQETCDEIVFSIDEKLEPIPQAADVRLQLLEQSGRLLETLLVDSADDETTLRLRYVQRGLQGDLAFHRNELVDAKSKHELSIAAARASLALSQDDPLRRHDVATGLVRLAKVLSRQGDVSAAGQMQHEAVDLLEELVASEPKNLRYRRDLAVVFDEMAKSLSAQGAPLEALAVCKQSRDLRQQLLAAEPENLQFKRDLGMSLELFATLNLQDQNAADAWIANEEALEIRRELVATDSFNAIYLRDMMVSLNDLGDHSIGVLGDQAEARERFDEAAEIARRLSAADPSNAIYVHDVIVSENRLGDLEQKAGNTEKAVEIFEQSTESSRKLVSQEPTNAVYQRGLAISLERLALLSQQLGKGAVAYEYVDEANEVWRRLCDQDPNNLADQRALAISINSNGDLRGGDGKPRQAADRYRTALAMWKGLHEQDSTDTFVSIELYKTHEKLADQLVKLKQNEDARSHYQQALAIVKELAKNNEFLGFAAITVEFKLNQLPE